MNERLASFKNTTSTHTHFDTKALKLKKKIMGWLKAIYKYETLEGVKIPKATLEEAIIDIEGKTDPRAIIDIEWL